LEDETSLPIRDKLGNRNADRIKQGFKAGGVGLFEKTRRSNKEFFHK
jgi:hypothetical protein